MKRKAEDTGSAVKKSKLDESQSSNTVGTPENEMNNEGVELNPYTTKLLELKDSNLLSFDKTTQIPFIINEFIVEETLPFTPNSVVKRARHHSIKKAVVIKQIVIPHGRLDEKLVKKIDSLKKEIEFLQLLSGSKNVVELYGFCIEREHLYICLESMDISLKELYLLVHKLYGNFPEELINKIIIKIVDALSECHANSITHRDIKPQNILVNWDGNIKLCDFGVSRILYETSSYTTAGTFPYMSPEYFTTGRYGLKTDVWSLGITIIEVLHGKNIIPDKTYPQIAELIKNLNSIEVIENLPKTYGDELMDFIKQCITIKTENRPTLEELKNLNLYKNENKDVSNSKKHDLITTILHKCRSLFEKDKSLWKDRYMETIPESLVTFQGKKIRLNKLIVEEDERLKELIDSEMLVKLINKNEVTIDHELINLSDTKNYYIDRTFKLPCIKETIFKDEKSDDLLAITGIDKTSLNGYVQEANKICLYEEYNSNRVNNVSFIILGNEQADEQFEQLCRLHQQRNIHWLKFEQDNLIWKRSYGSISKLHEYINEGKNYQYTENELLNQASQQKVIIISDTSGMGKSTVLTNLALKIKEHDPALWLIRVNLNEHTDQLEEQKKMVLQHKLSMKTIEVATQFLANDVLKLTIPFEQALFKYYCQHGKLIIMFDGFDEICPGYRDIVIDLMLGLRNSKIKQLWVTSRPTEQLILEKKLQNISYKLESFSGQNQIDFLTKFWKQTLNTVTDDQKKFKVYANALIKLLSESTSDKDKEFTGIPLQIRMLAEAFVADFETFYNSSTGELQLPTKLDLNDLYNRFFEKKYDIYQKEKNKLDLSKPGVKKQSDESYAEFIGKHQNLALCTLFKEHKLLLLSEKAYQEFSKNHPIVLATSGLNIENLKESLMNENEQKIKSFIDDIKEGKANTGIIDQIIEDKPHFIHRTFAEYLVGKFLVDSLDNEAIVEFVLQEILMQSAYQVTRAFLNGQLPEFLPENTLERYGKQIERLWQSDQKNLYNKEGMTLLHLAAKEGTVKIIRFFLNSLKGHETILKSLVEANIYYYRNLRTALHLAAAGGYLDVVQCLVEHGADVNVKSNSDQSALHCAAQKNKWDVVKWLVEHGKANVETTDNDGKTVLHWAAQANKWDVVKWLVKHGKANIEATDTYGRTVLLWAACGNLDVVQWLVEHEKANVEATDNYGHTVLHWAAKGNLDVVQWLMKHEKANVEATDKFGRTVLLWAARGNLYVVQWLVEHEKANVEATDNDGQTVLHWAVHGNLDVFKWLVEHGKANVDAIDNHGQTVLDWAASGNKWDIVQWLVEHGKVNVEAKNRHGRTVLFWAARGNLNVVRWLVEQEKANVETTDNYGLTVLHWAARGNLDIVQWLVEHGKANVEVTDNDGKTVLHWAAWGNLDVVKWLVEHGKANVETTDNNSQTVLHWAVRGNLDVVQWLVEHGKVNVEATDNDGRTVLHRAAQENKWDAVKWLMEHGKVNVEAADNDGRTVMHCAAQENKWDVVKWLVKHGADFNARDIDGKTPLNLAEERKHKK